MKFVFMPHNAYHVENMSYAVPHLRAAGADCVFVNIERAYHKEGAEAAIERLGLGRVDYSPDVVARQRPDALVVMNDWGGVVREKVVEANRRGIPTVCIVEGVQDFEDTHVEHIGVGGKRRPYRTAKYPLLIGEYDRRFIKTPRARVVGMPRVEHLCREEPVFPERPLVAINSNFTYGIYTAVQKGWIDGAVEACALAGMDYVITRHHADEMDLSGYNVSAERIHDVLRRCSVLVSRFSTCLLEAMALGKPVVYHNPHGERVDTFRDHMGAYRVTTDTLGLADALREGLCDGPAYRGKCRRFFAYHVSVTGVPSGRRIADELLDIPRREREGREGALETLALSIVGRTVYGIRGGERLAGFFR